MSESSSKPTINTRMPKGAKRPKTSRACLACRKLKARCEPAGGAKAAPADDPQPSSLSFVICHRCKTLCIDCLYETPAGEVVQGEDVQPAISSPSPAEEHNRAPRSSKRSRPEEAPSSDPFSNDRAVFLSPAISPSSLTRSIYRDVEICSLNTLQPAYLERPVLPANALSRLIGSNPALKRDAQDYILNLSGAFGSGSTHSWKQAPPDLCAGKAAARLMAGHAPLPAYPHDELEYLARILRPHEHQLRILFHGLYGAFSPFLSTPFEDSLILSNAQSEAQSFVLLTIYLAAFPHLEASQPIAQAKAPLRKAIDALLRRAIQSPQSDHLNIFALHNCASFLLLPVDGLAEDCRPISTPEQEVDGLLEFASDLNPRATIITALIVAQRLGYASLAARLPSLRQSFDVDSPQNGYPGDSTRDEYAHAVLCTFTWLTLLQFRASIDVAEDRVEWDSLAQFERDIPRVRIDAMTAALQPPPAFLSPREQSRCCWMAQRAELYGIARDHRHTKRAAASFTKKEAEDQAMGYKKALDEWRYKFGEQMRSMSTEFRKDPRGLGLHRFYSIFSNAEAASLQVAIGSVYHKEFVADMRQRLAEPFFGDGLPWKSAATILLGHEEDQLTKAILINFAFTDAMLKAMGLISSLTPVMPQLYDFVSYEESAGSEIPSLCIVAPPNLQAGLFAVPLLAAADLRLSVIETWGASASYFNHHVMPLLTNCVKSLRACHVNVDLPGVLKIPFATANPIADYLQGPFEILMRKVASAEERLQISHVESILNNSFLLSSKKKQIETVAEELAPDVPEMVQAIADSKKIEDEISAAMMGALNVQSIREIQDTDFAVKVFGSDLREGDVKAIRKPGRNGSSSATTPDAENHRRGPSNARSSSVESEQTGSPSVLTHSSKQRTPMHRSVRSVANASQYSSPSSSTQSGNAALPEPAVVYHKDPAVPPQGLEQTPAMGYAHPPTAYEASVLQPPSQPHEQALASSYAPISQTTHAGPTYAPAYAERSIDAPHGYSGPASGVHGMDAYASYPNERYPAESVLGLDAGHASAAVTTGTGTADVYAYRSDGDHGPVPIHSAAGYDGMQRQGAKAEGTGYDGYGNVPQEQPQVSEPWQQQHAQQQQGYGGAYGGDAASGQAYYGQQVSEQQYAEPYAPVYDQAHYQVGQGQHQVAQGQHGSTIWDAWNWTPGQDQPPHHPHPHQQHGHHQQQHQQHPPQQGQHHHHQQYRN
ncbi:uncharacterized protein PAN0_001d0700 [Moesziomyces antarcticus]|uniref:Zn(2)-C6 fungal-type domain-containing protein n=1 Tax=Pseudozyma antarctica TaxID=84753 RepID=A0A5C3FF93_PSEA2|nr:uncharacterized protein PAN0_001d0700 [Moesziomyces antarcticus]GAK62500.1 conserved hypothetical protein [Moesziomyces antarcticus]SPO43054.1 uncharacterized protein PSANT_00738 [Moesziomyces antarcticus]